MLSSILLQSLIESTAAKQKEQELLNENIFSPIKHIIDKIKEEHIKAHSKDFETAIDDFNVFLDVTKVSRISFIKEINDFANRTWKNIDKYKGLDRDHDKFCDETYSHNDKLAKIKETRVESYGKRAKGDYRIVFDKKFEEYLSVMPSELERFHTIQEKCKKIKKDLLTEYDKTISLYNTMSIECRKNSSKFDTYQLSVIQWLMDDLKEGAGVSAEDFEDTLNYIITKNIKLMSQNESTQQILTEASKKEDNPEDEVDTQSTEDNTKEDPTDTQEDKPDDNTEDNGNGNDDNQDNNDENQDDKTDENNEDDNNEEDDDPLKSDDDFSMDSGDDNGEGEDDGPPPDGLTDPDDDGSGDDADEDQETNVVTNILQLSSLDRTLAKKKCFTDFQDLRASISSFKKVIDDNEASLEAEIRDYTIAELDKLATSVKDYMTYRFRYINYEENVQNYMVFVAALQSLIDYVKNGGEKARKLTVKPTKKKKVSKKSKKELDKEKAEAELEEAKEEGEEESEDKESKSEEEPEEEPEEEKNSEESEEK